MAYSSGSGDSSGSGGSDEDETSSIDVCGGSASVERGVVANYSAETQVFSFTTERDTLEIVAGDDQHVQVDGECEDEPHV